MLKVNEEWLRNLAVENPATRETIEFFETLHLPPCPACGSGDSAKVSLGLVGPSITVAAATTKIRPLPNGPLPGDFYCNACGRYFGERKERTP